MAMRPSLSTRRRCIAGTSSKAGASSPTGNQGCTAQSRHCSGVVRPGAHADQPTTENSIIQTNVIRQQALKPSLALARVSLYAARPAFVRHLLGA
ncbi:hypothetical protein D3C81_1713170 [compost metagenome]